MILVAKSFLKNRVLSAILISLVITGILSIGIILQFLKISHLKIADNLYKLNNPSNEIEIIAIDTKSTSFEELDSVDRWSRDNYTNILKIIDKYDPKVIVLDITFSTQTSAIPLSNIKTFLEANKQPVSEDQSNNYKEYLESFIEIYDNPIDSRLREQINSMENVVIVNTFDNNNVLLPSIISGDITAISKLPTDNDGVVRRAIPEFTINGKKYDDIAVAAVKIYRETDHLDLVTGKNELLINYFGEPFSQNFTSFVDVLKEKADMSKFKDKIVLIGLTAQKESTDRYVTPRDNKNYMPGIEIRANEIQTILEEKFLVNQSKISQILTVFSIALVLTMIFNYLNITFSLAVVFASLAIYRYGAAPFAFKQGLILNMVYPFIAIIFAYIASWIYRYFVADRKGRELKGAFSHYISDKLVDQISKNPDTVKLGGEKREITIFFSDIQDSTKHSEQTEITSWISQINEYFTAMEYIIQKYNGTIDKYEGDAIMGFFNAPLDDPNHQLNAYNAALEMKAMLKNLHTKWQRDGKPLIQFRIGINTGEALVGNFGSNNRFDYTAMGDTVNTASRLESSANKTYGTKIIFTTQKEKLEQLQEQILFREIDTVFLPGKDKPVTIYEPICRASEKTTNAENIRSKYTKGLEFYKNKDFRNAISYFSCLEKDRPSRIMLGRCQTLSTGAKVDGLDENMIFHIKHK